MQDRSRTISSSDDRKSSKEIGIMIDQFIYMDSIAKLCVS